MVEHPRTHDQIEAALELTDVFEGQLIELEIR
jgi:hypothetical protein